MGSRVVIGLRAHSGWAVAVTLGGPARAPVIVDRRRLELAGPATPRPVQPYHASEGLPLPKAVTIVSRAIEEARRFGERDLGALVRDLRSAGHEIAGCAVLTGFGRPLPPLGAILASHALIHAAEGEMFRAALREASASAGLAVSDVTEKGVFGACAKAVGQPEEKVLRHMAEIGRVAGPPWAEDQKVAAAGAWARLAAEGT